MDVSIGLVIVVTIICFVAAALKASDPHYTIGGPEYRTPFWSSMFFVVLGLLLLLSLLLPFINV